jgi:hypothetical protein
MTYIDNWSYDECPEMDVDYPYDPEVDDAAHSHEYKKHCVCGTATYEDAIGQTRNWDNYTRHVCSNEISMEEVLGKPKENTMNNIVKFVPRPKSEPSGISAFTLKVGEYGRVVGAGSYAGHIVLKAREYVVDITNPNNIWLVNDFTAPYVETLKTGDRLEITLGFTSEFVERIAKMAKENKINAIKEVRTVTDWGLKESKEYVESLLLPF